MDGWYENNSGDRARFGRIRFIPERRFLDQCKVNRIDEGLFQRRVGLHSLKRLRDQLWHFAETCETSEREFQSLTLQDDSIEERIAFENILLKKFPTAYTEKGLSFPEFERFPALPIYDLYLEITDAEPFGRIHILGKTPKTMGQGLSVDRNNAPGYNGLQDNVSIGEKPKAALKEEGRLNDPQEKEEKQLSPCELEEFLAFAKAYPWDSNSGVRPSEHIKTKFAKWLKRGLSRSNIVEGQKNLAGAYATEVSLDPSKRVEELVVRPHTLPPGAKRALSARLVSELSPQEREQKREMERQKKRRQREQRKNPMLSP